MFTPGGMSVCPKCSRWSCSCRRASSDNRAQTHQRADYKGRTICSCGDFNCASLDGRAEG